MNIVFIPHLPTLYGRRYNLAKGLVANGHEVHFIIWDLPYPFGTNKVLPHIANSFKSQCYEESPGLFIHKIRRLPFFWPYINGMIFKKQIRAIYHKQNASFIISQAFTNETVPPLDLPLVYDINDDHQAFADNYGSFLYRLGYKLLRVRSVISRQTQKAILVTVVSDVLKKTASQYNDNVIKIPNGVEKAAITYSKAHKINTKKYSLIYVSTFGKWSQLSQLINAIDDISKRYLNVHLDLVGEGEELEKAVAQVKDLNLENKVTFHGKVNDRQEIFRLISKAEVCLNISEKNRFRDSASPIKVLEYSAFGKKVVSSSLAEVVKLKFPNIYFYKNVENSASIIAESFKANVDKKAVQRLVEENYTWEKLSAKILLSLENSSQAIADLRSKV